MKRQLYVIHDRVAQESGPIREIVNDGVAWRWFKQTMTQNMGDNDLFDETDFCLFHIGEVDKVTNLINPLKPREVYINLELLEEEKNAESL